MLFKLALSFSLFLFFPSLALALGSCRGLARTQTPTNTNYAPEFPTFGEIARVSLTEVQWKGLALGEPPC